MDKKEDFLKIIKDKVKRSGIDEFVLWLELTDFFEAPSSSRFHGNHKGGLVEHSVNVYNHLLKLNDLYKITDNEETLAIISLFHDVTKINYYKTDTKNVKNDDGVWEKVACYTISEQFAFGGHGSKSVYLIQKYMQLTDEEAVCINTHMGAFDRPQGDYSLSVAWEMFPLAILSHTADVMASYVDEKK